MCFLWPTDKDDLQCLSASSRRNNVRVRALRRVQLKHFSCFTTQTIILSNWLCKNRLLCHNWDYLSTNTLCVGVLHARFQSNIPSHPGFHPSIHPSIFFQGFGVLWRIRGVPGMLLQAIWSLHNQSESCVCSQTYFQWVFDSAKVAPYR